MSNLQRIADLNHDVGYRQGYAEGYQQGRADERTKIQDILNHRDYDFHKDGDYYSIDEVFEQIKERKNETN